MNSPYDVIIIGGGINGTGVLRDCALRGLSALLIEKKDLGGGTTGASSGMVHGGLRYLLSDVKTTKISCRDSGFIQQMAPFLHFRIPLLYLLHPGKNQVLLETFFEAYDRYAHLKNGKKHTRLSQKDIRTLEPGLGPDILGAISFDEWGVDPYRLCVLNAKDGVAHGSKVLLHHEVTELLFENPQNRKKVIGVEVKTPTGKKEKFFGKIVLNCGGPWASKLAEMAGVQVRLRPAKGIHLVFERRISNYGIVTDTVDNRSIFLLPYQNTSIIGTTDDDFYGDPDRLEVTKDEVEYLYEAIERVFPTIRNHRLIGTYAGIRPTLYAWGESEDNLSRSHHIFDHEKEGVEGFLSIAGGKLASFRLMSEELTDVVCKKLKIRKKCITAQTLLPGAEEKISKTEIQVLAKRAGMSSCALHRLYVRHGSGIKEILSMIEKHPSWKRLICLSEPVLEAEIRYVIQKEWATSLDDVGRRTRLGWGGCQGIDCAWPASIILKEMCGQDPEGQVQTFFEKRSKSLEPDLRGASLALEELKRGAGIL